MNWQDKLKQLIKERNDRYLGGSPDYFFPDPDPIIHFLQKVENLAISIWVEPITIDVKNYCEVAIKLPRARTYQTTSDQGRREAYDNAHRIREDILLYMLTELVYLNPRPTSCLFNKEKDQITLQWNY